MRTVRAISGVKIEADEMVTVTFDGPSAAITSTRVTTTGSASRASMKRPIGLVDPAPQVAGDEAEDGAEHRAQHGRDERHESTVARAGDHPREDVAAELVGAEPVRADGRRVDAVEILVERRVRREW